MLKSSPIGPDAHWRHVAQALCRCDLGSHATTLVVLALEQTANGFKLTVTESGFDQIPLARRATAFSANEGGWIMVMKVIEEHLAKNP